MICMLYEKYLLILVQLVRDHVLNITLIVYLISRLLIHLIVIETILFGQPLSATQHRGK